MEGVIFFSFILMEKKITFSPILFFFFFQEKLDLKFSCELIIQNQNNHTNMELIWRKFAKFQNHETKIRLHIALIFASQLVQFLMKSYSISLCRFLI